MLKIKTIFLCTFILASSIFIFPQDIDIISYLKQIEAGNSQEVRDNLSMLKKKYPNSASILFLEGILTENGKQAVSIYASLLKKYPQSKYADGALYRIYTYYFAVGKYTSAKLYLEKLKKEYPQSPYIKIALRNVPAKDVLLIEDSNKSTSISVNENTGPKLEESINYKYTIQAGAFTVLSNAEALKKELENAGYSATIEEKSVAGTTFHVVYTGKFQNIDEAKNFLQLINSKYNLDGRLVTLETARSS